MWILSPLFMYQKGNQRAMKKACRDALEWGCRDFDWEIFADVYGFQICSRIAGTFLPGAGSIPGHGRKERRGRAVRFGCQEDVPWTTWRCLFGAWCWCGRLESLTRNKCHGTWVTTKYSHVLRCQRTLFYFQPLPEIHEIWCFKDLFLLETVKKDSQLNDDWWWHLDVT